MGQAKARGNYTDRVAESVAKTQAQLADRERLQNEAEDRDCEQRMALARDNPEQYEREKRERWETHAVVAMAAGALAATRCR